MRLGDLQLTFFIIVSSSKDYAAYLGGSATFSGLVIGIPTAISGLVLLPLMSLDQGKSHDVTGAFEAD